MSVFLAFGLLALTAIGTEQGALLLGLAVAAHLSSVLDVLLPATRGADARWLQVTRGLAVVGAVTYLPLAVFTHCFFNPWQVSYPVATLEVGDGVLTSAAVYYFRAPRPGDVVIYETPRLQVAAALSDHTQYIIQGRRLDRVVAGPGQNVRIEGGKLFVDGSPSPYLLLNPGSMPDAFAMVVPPERYLILPSTLATAGMRLSPDSWRDLTLIPGERIYGLVYARYWPWNHFELL